MTNKYIEMNKTKELIARSDIVLFRILKAIEAESSANAVSMACL